MTLSRILLRKQGDARCLPELRRRWDHLDDGTEESVERMKRDSSLLVITATAAVLCVGASWLALRRVERPLRDLTSSTSAERDAASEERCEIALLDPTASEEDSERLPLREPVVLDAAVRQGDPSLALRRRQMRLLLDRLSEERRRTDVSWVVWHSTATPAVPSSDELMLTVVSGHEIHLDGPPDGVFRFAPTRAATYASTPELAWNADGLELVLQEPDGEARLQFRIECALEEGKQR
jgi:hypothetical protein